MTKFSLFPPQKFKSTLLSGFTIVELLVVATISTVIAGSSLYILNDYHNSSIRSANRRNLISSTDNTLRIITNEIKQASKIHHSKASIGLPSGGGLFGGSGNVCSRLIRDSEFLFALELPDQVMSKVDYYKDLKKSDYKSKRIKNFISSDCNYIFYGIQKNPVNRNKTKGPFSLYRIGYDQNVEGYYNSQSVSKSILNDSISDTILSPNSTPKICDLNYYRTVKSGVQVCIDKISQRTLHLTLVSKNPNYGSSFFHTRSGSASTVVSKGGSPFICIGPDCDRRDCNNAIFLLDISGSMNAPMQFRQQRISRIAAARDELINVAKSCPDGSKINVYTFNGGSRGSSFKPQLVALNDSIRRQLKTWLEHPNQRPWGGTYPWRMMERAFKSPTVERVHVISDGATSKAGCFNGRCGDAAMIFKSKNDVRDPNSLIVNSYSLDDDFCTGNNRFNTYPWIDARWMGRIADSCKVVK